MSVSNSIQLSREVADVPVKFQPCILKTVRMHVEFTVSEWLTILVWPLRRYGWIISPYTTFHVESSTFLWCFNSLSWNSAKARRIHVFFWVICSVFLTLWGYGRIVVPSAICPGGHWRSCEISTLHLENCANARRIHVFWVVNPLFPTQR